MIQIVTDIQANRLIYVLDFVFNHILKTGYTICNENEVDATKPVIYYVQKYTGNNKIAFHPTEIIRDSHQVEVKNIEIISDMVQRWLNGTWSNETMDPFAVIFCYLSRYEEYLERRHIDNWHRFLAADSVLNQLSPDEPIVDMMVLWIKRQISEKYPDYIFPESKGFRIISTIDIDQAWSYKYKGWRNILTFCKFLMKLEFGSIRKQFSIVFGKKEDPFDTYSYLKQLHHKLDIQPLYFILMSERRSSIDRNHKPSNPRFRKLIQELENNNEIGIHPSYRSRKEERLLQREINLLSEIIQKPISASRQHYLIMKLPETYRRLIASGITDDYTMGFVDRIGYRAGTGHTFYWYDIKNETTTPLKIHPFIMMDATLRRYMKLNVKQAVEKIVAFKKQARKYEVPFTVLWHNSSLDEDGEWKGWKQVYEIALNC